ncbi:MAG: TonB family protein [Chloroherpetonaceae bacterium]|nr:TonB family protein [Chloroherpetonaceae bacterium]
MRRLSVKFWGEYPLRILFGFSAFLIFHSVLCVSQTIAQNQGRLMGRVIDEGGVPLAGATLYINGTATQAAITNAQGYYTFLSLPEGSYKMRVFKRGLPAKENIEVSVNSGATTRADFRLGANTETQVAEVKQTPSVSAKPKPSETKASESKQVASNSPTTPKQAAVAPSIPKVAQPEKQVQNKEDEELERLTQENLAADDLEIEATIDEQADIVGGISAIYSKIKYPDMARQQRLEGKVVARVFIDKTGSVIKVDFLKALNPVLDNEVFRVLTEETKFTPAKAGGKDMPATLVIPFNFKSN